MKPVSEPLVTEKRSYGRIVDDTLDEIRLTISVSSLAAFPRVDQVHEQHQVLDRTRARPCPLPHTDRGARRRSNLQVLSVPLLGGSEMSLVPRPTTALRNGISGPAADETDGLSEPRFASHQFHHLHSTARSKGKVESGVKYVKRNALAGRRFASWDDLNAWLEQWSRTVADLRVHGTTHERPIDRFGRERLVPLGSRPPYKYEQVKLRRVPTTPWWQ